MWGWVFGLDFRDIVFVVGGDGCGGNIVHYLAKMVTIEGIHGLFDLLWMGGCTR